MSIDTPVSRFAECGHPHSQFDRPCRLPAHFHESGALGHDFVPAAEDAFPAWALTPGDAFAEEPDDGGDGLGSLIGDAPVSAEVADGQRHVNELNVRGALLPSPKRPTKVAAQIVAEDAVNDLPTLAHWRGQYWTWTGAHYEPISEADMRARLYVRTKDAVWLAPVKESQAGQDGVILLNGGYFRITSWNPSRSSIADLNDALGAEVHERDGQEAPLWRLGAPEGAPAPKSLLACANGALNLATRELTANTPALLNLYSVPYAYDAHAPEPRVWLDFLASVWPDDPESIDLIQEWFGYILSGRTDLQKMLVLLGPPRSGKGVIMSVLTAMIGAASVAGPQMGAFASSFGMSQLIGRQLAVIGDARVPARDKDQILEKLLMITGEDTVQVDVKHKEPWNGRLPTRLAILSNDIPTFADESGALAARMLVATTTQSFEGREDRSIKPRILENELAGVLNWALAGLDRLVANGLRFTSPASAEAAWSLYREAAQPVNAFLADRCITGGPEALTEKNELFKAWSAWCADEAGRDHAGTVVTFSKALYAAGKGVKEFRKRDASGKFVKYYRGVRLDPDKGPTPGSPGGAWS